MPPTNLTERLAKMPTLTTKQVVDLVEQEASEQVAAVWEQVFMGACRYCKDGIQTSRYS